VPALFTASGGGSGQAEALNQNGTLNSAANPAAAGSTVALFATGAAGSMLAVTIQGESAAVQSVSTATAGVEQIDVQIPTGLASGTASVVLVSDGVSSPPVTIAIH